MVIPANVENPVTRRFPGRTKLLDNPTVGVELSPVPPVITISLVIPVIDCI